MKKFITISAKIIKFLGLNSFFEYLILFFEYAYIKSRFFIYNVTACLLTYLSITKLDLNIDYSKYAEHMHSNLVTVIGILLGFSISTLTILLTVDNNKVSEAKAEFIGRKILGRKITLYDSILTGIAYVVVIQCCLLLLNFIYPIFIDIESKCGLTMFALSIAILLHVILTLMREILNFYFIITKK